jgi:hypothetical protein
MPSSKTSNLDDELSTADRSRNSNRSRQSSSQNKQLAASTTSVKNRKSSDESRTKSPSRAMTSPNRTKSILSTSIPAVSTNSKKRPRPKSSTSRSHSVDNSIERRRNDLDSTMNNNTTIASNSNDSKKSAKKAAPRNSSDFPLSETTVNETYNQQDKSTTKKKTKETATDTDALKYSDQNTGSISNAAAKPVKKKTKKQPISPTLTDFASAPNPSRNSAKTVSTADAFSNVTISEPGGSRSKPLNKSSKSNITRPETPARISAATNPKSSQMETDEKKKKKKRKSDANTTSSNLKEPPNDALLELGGTKSASSNDIEEEFTEYEEKLLRKALNDINQTESEQKDTTQNVRKEEQSKTRKVGTSTSKGAVVLAEVGRTEKDTSSRVDVEKKKKETRHKNRESLSSSKGDDNLIPQKKLITQHSTVSTMPSHEKLLNSPSQNIEAQSTMNPFHAMIPFFSSLQGLLPTHTPDLSRQHKVMASPKAVTVSLEWCPQVRIRSLVEENILIPSKSSNAARPSKKQKTAPSSQKRPDADNEGVLETTTVDKWLFNFLLDGSNKPGSVWQKLREHVVNLQAPISKVSSKNKELISVLLLVGTSYRISVVFLDEESTEKSRLESENGELVEVRKQIINQNFHHTSTQQCWMMMVEADHLNSFGSYSEQSLILLTPTCSLYNLIPNDARVLIQLDAEYPLSSSLVQMTPGPNKKRKRNNSIDEIDGTSQLTNHEIVFVPYSKNHNLVHGKTHANVTGTDAIEDSIPSGSFGYSAYNGNDEDDEIRGTNGVPLDPIDDHHLALDGDEGESLRSDDMMQSQNKESGWTPIKTNNVDRSTDLPCEIHTTTTELPQQEGHSSTTFLDAKNSYDESDDDDEELEIDNFMKKLHDSVNHALANTREIEPDSQSLPHTKETTSNSISIDENQQSTTVNYTLDKEGSTNQDKDSNLSSSSQDSNDSTADYGLVELPTADVSQNISAVSAETDRTKKSIGNEAGMTVVTADSLSNENSEDASKSAKEQDCISTEQNVDASLIKENFKGIHTRNIDANDKQDNNSSTTKESISNANGHVTDRDETVIDTMQDSPLNNTGDENPTEEVPMQSDMPSISLQETGGPSCGDKGSHSDASSSSSSSSTSSSSSSSSSGSSSGSSSSSSSSGSSSSSSTSSTSKNRKMKKKDKKSTTGTPSEQPTTAATTSVHTAANPAVASTVELKSTISSTRATIAKRPIHSSSSPNNGSNSSSRIGSGSRPLLAPNRKVIIQKHTPVTGR